MYSYNDCIISGINLKNNVVIIDEAHNLLESIAQMHSSEVTYDQLSIAHHLMKSYKMKYCTRFSASNLLCLNQLLFVTSKIVDYLGKGMFAYTNSCFKSLKFQIN